MGKKQKLSLGSISSNYNVILIDNCAFHQILNGKDKLSMKSIEDKLNDRIFIKDSLKFWKENIPIYGNIYTTLKVVEEMENVQSYNYGKSIKKDCRNKRKPNLLNLRRATKNLNTERNLLIRALEEEQKILKFNKKEQDLYNRFYEKHLKLHEDYLKSDNCDGVVDYDLLISGGVMAKLQGSSAIISNDFGIVSAWRDFLKREKLSNKKFGFFLRTGLEIFKKL